MSLPQKTLESARLRLRALRLDDADGYYAICSDPVAMRYSSHVPYTDRQQAVDKVASLVKLQAESASLALAITLRENDSYVGNVSLFSMDMKNFRCEVGYALLPSLQGKGYAAEALRLALAYAFDDLGLQRIEADIDPRNTASCKLVERVGFKQEGLLRSRWHVASEVCDTAFYGLLKDEFIR